MNTKKVQTEQEIDEIVEIEANDDSAWDETISVKKETTLLRMPAELAKRAAFLAQLHHKPDYESWIAQIIRERIEIEEGAYRVAKREMAVGK